MTEKDLLNETAMFGWACGLGLGGSRNHGPENLDFPNCKISRNNESKMRRFDPRHPEWYARSVVLDICWLHPFGPRVSQTHARPMRGGPVTVALCASHARHARPMRGLVVTGRCALARSQRREPGGAKDCAESFLDLTCPGLEIIPMLIRVVLSYGFA